MSDIIEVEATTKPAVQLHDLNPRPMVDRASEVANVLADVIEKQKLFTMIQGKKYVNVEGWEVCGNLLSILPKERQVIEHDDGSYEAYVDLVNMRTGMVVGGGSALCGMDESRWKKADRYARRSMAITRATGKAYRLCFAWVMALAGYNTTPAEEMPYDVESPKKKKPSPKPAEKKDAPYTGTDEQKQLLQSLFIEAKINDAKEKQRIAGEMEKHKILFPSEARNAFKELCVEIPF